MSVPLGGGSDRRRLRHTCRHLEHRLYGESASAAALIHPVRWLMSVWFPCVQAFELATGDYLFDPQAGATFSREEGLSLISLCLITGLLFQYLLLCFQTISPTSSSCWDPSLPSLHFRDETRNDTSTARVKLPQSRVL